MKNLLILLTNYFPYYKGEEYLESELPILAKEFDTIIICSCMIDDKQEMTRTVPDNVIVIPSGVDHGKRNRLHMIAKGLKTKEQEKRELTSSQKMFAKYFEARSKMISEALIERIKMEDLKDFDRVTIYSYWIYVTARAAIDIKEELFADRNPLIISRAHRYDLYEEENKLGFLPSREFIFDNLDYVFPVSQSGKDSILHHHPSYADKIIVEKLGSQPNDLRIEPVTRPFHLVSCSGIREVKRLNLIIDAVKILLDRGLDVKWTHLGAGELEDEIKKYAGDNLPKDRFHFTGHINNQEILPYYVDNKASLFVNVSASEGIPVSIMEAISIGLPVVATDVGGTREIVVDGKNGTLLPEDCTGEDVADAIEKIYHLNPEEYTGLSDEAMALWEQEYNAKTNYENFAQWLKTTDSNSKE